VIFTRVPLSQMFTNSVTLAITRPSVPDDGPVAGPMSRSLSFPIHSLRPSLVTINYKKKNSATSSTAPPARLPLHHASRWPSSLLLPPRCARPQPPSCCVASTADTARWGTACALSPGGSATAHRGPHGRPPAAILFLPCDHIAGFRCAVLRLPGCQVLMKVHVASVCFNCFRCFRGLFQRFVANRLGCCMLQRSVTNVSFVFSDVRCKCVYLDVAYISHICYICFIWMLHMFALVSSVFRCLFSSVSEPCFKCFICIQMYVAIVAFGCFKNR
jgi:hypothetical protein